MSRWIILALIWGLALVLTGCSGDSTPNPPEADEGTFQEASSDYIERRRSLDPGYKSPSKFSESH